MNNNRGDITIVILIIIIAGLAGAVYLYSSVFNNGKNGLTDISPEVSQVPTSTIEPTNGEIDSTATPPHDLPTVVATATPTVSLNNNENEFIPFEIPIKYWTHDAEPAAKIQVEAPKESNVVTDDSTVPALQFPDGSKLNFAFSHAAFEEGLNEDEIIPVETNNYENTYRYLHNGEMTYAYVKTETTCKGKDNTILNPPCGAPVFHGMIITCTDASGTYSTCDEVMETIGGLEPHY